jgi:hypothetical protein
MPGIVFVVGTVPLLPSRLEVNPISALLPTVAVGFVVGQAIHTLSTALQSVSPNHPTTISHRELFRELLSGTEVGRGTVSDALVSDFIHSVNREYSSDRYRRGEVDEESADGNLINPERDDITPDSANQLALQPAA